MTSEERKDFRSIYTELWGKDKTLKLTVTEEIAANPRYKRYKELAPLFYSEMIKFRKDRGMRW